MQPPSESAATTAPNVWALKFRVRFDPPETEENALLEQDNIIEHLQRVGYDVEPMWLNRVDSKNVSPRAFEPAPPPPPDSKQPPKPSAATSCNGLRLPDMKPLIHPLREVVETISCDDVLRVERLSCGHTKTTWTPRQRPAYRRRCLKCEPKVTA